MTKKVYTEDHKSGRGRKGTTAAGNDQDGECLEVNFKIYHY